jgi:hypothetical protein
MSWNGRGFRGPSRQALPPLLHTTRCIGRSPRPTCKNMPVTQCAAPRHKRWRRQAIRSPITLAQPVKAPPGIVLATRRSAALPVRSSSIDPETGPGDRTSRLDRKDGGTCRPPLNSDPEHLAAMPAIRAGGTA